MRLSSSCAGQKSKPSRLMRTAARRGVRSGMRLALIHDWLNQRGGAEDVLEKLVGLFPGAPVYTSMYWRAGMPAAYRHWPIRVSFMDRLPGVHRHHQPYLPPYPLAFERFDFSGYQV